MTIRTLLAATAVGAGLAAAALTSCGNNSTAPTAPSTGPTASAKTAGDARSDDRSSDDRSRDGTSDNFSNDNKSNDGSPSNDGDSSGDGNSFNRASGGFDGINFRAAVQTWQPACRAGLAPPCLTLILKGVPVTVVNETEIWDFTDPNRPQITIDQFQAMLESGAASVVKGEGLPLDDLDGVSLDGDDVSADTFIAVEVDIIN